VRRKDLGGWVKNETLDISRVEAVSSVDFGLLPSFPHPASTAPGSIHITHWVLINSFWARPHLE
jgi:hypothetical protein